MNNFFICKNGRKLIWTSVCDGYNQCIDGSDEENCYCQDNIYACLQGNNVSCRIACTTYGHVTCLTYQNRRACEQYIREYSNTTYYNINLTSKSFLFTNDFNKFWYFIFLIINIILFISIFIYLFRKKIFQLLFSYSNKLLNIHRKSTNSLSSIFQQQSSTINLSHLYNINNLPLSYYYSDQNSISINNFYESSSYLDSSIQHSNSNYYEIIKTPSLSNSMSLPDSSVFNNIRTYYV